MSPVASFEQGAATQVVCLDNDEARRCQPDWFGAVNRTDGWSGTLEDCFNRVRRPCIRPRRPYL